MIAQEVKRRGWASIFSATPPTWAFRYLYHRFATRRRGVHPSGRPRKRRKLGIIDLRRAYLHANATGKTYVKPPHLEHEPVLEDAPYGTSPRRTGSK